MAAGAVEPPLRIGFQGKLLDASNNPRNGTVDLLLRFFDAPTGGTQLQIQGVNWSETIAGVPVSNGVFSVQIGTKTALHPDLFSGTSAYLDIQVDAANAGGPAGYQTLLPRQSLAMSPWALSASQLSSKNAIRVNSGMNYSTFTVGGDLLIPYGLSAGTGSFSLGITASSGSFTAAGDSQFSVVTASGIYMSSGTLHAAGAGGIVVNYGIISTTGVIYGLSASTANLTGSGLGTWSLVTASGIYVSSGTLFNNADGGFINTYGLEVGGRSSFTATSNTAYTLTLSSGMAMLNGSLKLGSDNQRTIHANPSTGDIEVTTNTVIFGSMSATNFDEVFLASNTLTAAGATLNISFAGAGYQFLKFYLNITGVAASNLVRVGFNGDAGNNYYSYPVDALGAGTAVGPVGYIQLQEAGVATAGLFKFWASNYYSTPKMVLWEGTRGSGGATPTLHHGGGSWNNTTAWITAINISNSAANNFTAGTTIRVFGVR